MEVNSVSSMASMEIAKIQANVNQPVPEKTPPKTEEAAPIVQAQAPVREQVPVRETARTREPVEPTEQSPQTPEDKNMNGEETRIDKYV